MYLSGLIIGYLLGFITFFIKARYEKDQSPFDSFMIALLGSLIPAILSWLGVLIIIAYWLGVGDKRKR